ncbi:MAG: sigma-54-dependent transcriptional regulator [Thermodesulfobacteriota bacterium]
MDREKILVVDDEKSMREFLSIFLKREGYEVMTAASGKEAMKLFDQTIFDMVITDIKMPRMNGLDLLKATKDRNPETAVIMITAYASVDTAVEAMKRGAYDYISKPFKVDEIKLIINNALEKRKLKQENILLKKAFKEKYSFKNIIGKSPKMLDIYRLISTVASTRANVLISGESGTGKELVAKAIHNESSWKDGPFVAVNCGAIPENLLESELFGHQRGAFTGAVSDKKGIFEVANGGTIFLDEITELAYHLQVKILRAIQEKSFKRVGGIEEIKINVRIISATNKDIEKEVKKEKFREDLYYRLNVIPVMVPPLRDRKEDIPLLASHFLDKFSAELDKDINGFATETMEFLTQYPYPGNVRELENIVESAVAMEGSDLLLQKSLPLNLLEKKTDSFDGGEIPPEGINFDKVVEDTERKLLMQALKESGGVRKNAAKLLNISFRSLRYLLSKYGIT